MNLPNKLTVARCMLAALFVLLMSFEHAAAYFAAFAVFIAATITDYYDGKIARARNLITNFGQLLDPVADKILMAAGFIMLMKVPALRVPGWAVVAVFGREFFITGARALAAAQGAVLPANKYGKRKAVLQMAYVLTFLFLAACLQLLRHLTWPPAGWTRYMQAGVGVASYVCMVAVAIYTVYSGVQFVRIHWKTLGLHEQL